MMKLGLVRIDSRLLHGQVVTYWLRSCQATHVVIIDDNVKRDANLSMVFKLCCPKGVTLSICTCEEAGQLWANSQWDEGVALVLFSDPQGALKAYEAGFQYPSLQVGGIGASPSSKAVIASIHLNSEQSHVLQQLSDKGVRVTFQQTPMDKVTVWDPKKHGF